MIFLAEADWPTRLALLFGIVAKKYVEKDI
jgi:hypothetical protein